MENQKIPMGKFWQNFEKWQHLGQKKIYWRENWLANEFCPECRLCCGPQGNDEPFPMPLLSDQLVRNYEDNFYLLSPSIAFIGQNGCKSDGKAGCKLAIKEKPVACNLFPMVLINGKLYLYQNCPAALFLPLASFMETGKKAAEFLMKFTLKELEHLSINIDFPELAEKYIDLHIRIFSHNTRKIILE